MTTNSKGNCKVCDHAKEEHTSHKHKDHRGIEIVSIGCNHTIKTDYIEDFMGKGNTMPISHSCSCHGVKPNQYLQDAIDKYKKFLKEKTDKTLVKDMYIRKELLNHIKRFKKDIEENPDNLLHWQKQEIVT